MNYTRTTALAALGVTGALLLTACGSDDSANDSSSKGSSSTSSSPTNGGSQSKGRSNSTGAQAGNTASGSGEGTESGSGAANGTTKTGGKAKAGGKVTFCKTPDLAINATNAAPDKSSGRIDITMVNRGSTTCSATGFAGVDIKDADHTSNPIERGHAQPRVTTLKPGDTAVFNLAYDIDTTGHSLASPTNILVTPPNETHTVSLKWPAAAGKIKGAYTDVQVYPTHTTK
ncbi:DUF4232 domain-containing protein [Streptomyces melanogenes]|uniref:DUF4232 domain-containing protein n=1 Tax=Streptomyces melanogenes TaxID=67326 RepID=UPI00167E99D2|nr:DUF4232 domain-containing protein [Streptomyces melanogenes]GGP56384.1 hypothetical protein GCM10010278_36710 [Streptomyces melanogenes]